MTLDEREKNNETKPISRKLLAINELRSAGLGGCLPRPAAVGSDPSTLTEVCVKTSDLWRTLSVCRVEQEAVARI